MSSNTFRNVIGLVPAAGLSSRVAPLPASKELYPIGFGPIKGKDGLRPKVVTQYLIEQMQLAGVRKAFIVLRKGKWDIPDYFGDGQDHELHLAYLIMRLPYGVPYTLDQAYPFIKSATIVFGFPDIVFFPENTYVRLLDKLSQSGADIVLGAFEVQRNAEKMDMLVLDAQDRVCDIHIKPLRTRLTHTWIVAVWTPAFTHFMHELVARDAKARAQREPSKSEGDRELHMGDVIRAGIESGINTEIVHFDTGCFLDIGTPDDIQFAAEFVHNALKH